MQKPIIASNHVCTSNDEEDLYNVDIDTINHCGTASGFETEVRPDFVHSKIEAEENTINCEILHLLSLALKGLQLAVTPCC